MAKVQKAWAQHEDYVASLYRALGYTVTQDTSREGQQVDIVAEIPTRGGGVTRLYIDAKYTASGRSYVGKDDIDRFANSYHARRDNQGWTEAVLVSNRRFTQQAKAAAEAHHGLTLKTLLDLQDDLLNIRLYLLQSLNDYQAEGTFNQYIDLLCRAAATDLQPHGDPTDLLRYTEAWIEQSSAQQLCLLGDFGSGKTTFLKYIHHKYIQSYLAGDNTRIPLFIPLRDYTDAPTSGDMITRFLSIECRADVDYELFQTFLAEGRFLLLLDGFDEMGKASDETTRRRDYLKLSELVIGASKSIITCRPAYFRSNMEMSRVFIFLGPDPPGPRQSITFRPQNQLYATLADYLATRRRLTRRSRPTAITGTLEPLPALYLQLFDAGQVKTYLTGSRQRIMDLSGGQYNDKLLLTMIRDIYDLEDLSHRPILLNLIVDILPLFKETSSGTYEIEINGTIHTVTDITPSILYYAYTENELEREYQKLAVRSSISKGERVELISFLSYQMLVRGSLTLDGDQLARAIEQQLSPDPERVSPLVTDIRTCSFLVRDKADRFRFTHRSFMEYFTAQYLRKRMGGLPELKRLLADHKLSNEMQYFLGDCLATDGSNALSALSTTIEDHPSTDSEASFLLYNVLKYFGAYKKRLTARPALCRVVGCVGCLGYSRDSLGHWSGGSSYSCSKTTLGGYLGCQL